MIFLQAVIAFLRARSYRQLTVAGIALSFLVGALIIWLGVVRPMQSALEREGVNSASRDYQQQDDGRVDSLARQVQPGPRPRRSDKQLYWGDLHIHTQESFDSRLFGNPFGIEDAYRFAAGEPLTSVSGETLQLARPLDFVAITDHAEGFGTLLHCDSDDLSWLEQTSCWLMMTPNPLVFATLVNELRGQPIEADKESLATGPAGVYQAVTRRAPGLVAFLTCRFSRAAADRCRDNAALAWQRFTQLADDYNQPGTLTTLIGYEYSPVLPNRGKHHRNVIFRSSTVPDRALSFLDTSNAFELWRGLERDCTGRCDFLTIPHNPNKSWGLTFSRHTWDGLAYQESDWRLRQAHEPLVEIFQVKGASECALDVGATDEECTFEQVLPVCEPGQTTGCAFTTGFTRQGLKLGLELEQSLGLNPLRLGFVGATDSHNANPGDVEEWDWGGATGSVSSSALRRLRENPLSEPFKVNLSGNNPGGMTAVWADNPSREAIFDALARRETYATSGPRIAVRFFAGYGIDSSIWEDVNLAVGLPSSSVTMGGVLRTGGHKTAPTFMVWATRDPLDAPLQRVQMVKGWIDDSGNSQERVTDIGCSDGLSPDSDTHRCPDNGASVDLETCAYSLRSGASEMKISWQDPEFDAQQNAFYYVRVLMNPTCRWSTYDAIRLGKAPSPSAPATIRERAWTSPIWLSPNAPP